MLSYMYDLFSGRLCQLMCRCSNRVELNSHNSVWKGFSTFFTFWGLIPKEKCFKGLILWWFVCTFFLKKSVTLLVFIVLGTNLVAHNNLSHTLKHAQYWAKGPSHNCILKWPLKIQLGILYPVLSRANWTWICTQKLKFEAWMTRSSWKLWWICKFWKKKMNARRLWKFCTWVMSSFWFIWVLHLACSFL